MIDLCQTRSRKLPGWWTPAGRVRHQEALSTSPWLLPALCTSSIWLFLGHSLYNKTIVIRVSLSSWVILVNDWIWEPFICRQPGRSVAILVSEVGAVLWAQLGEPLLSSVWHELMDTHLVWAPKNCCWKSGGWEMAEASSVSSAGGTPVVAGGWHPPAWLAHCRLSQKP